MPRVRLIVLTLNQDELPPPAPPSQFNAKVNVWPHLGIRGYSEIRLLHGS
jgi:hypothetical protein